MARGTNLLCWSGSCVFYHRGLVTMRRGHGHGMKRLVTDESEADKAARKAIGMKQLWMYVQAWRGFAVWRLCRIFVWWRPRVRTGGPRLPAPSHAPRLERACVATC